MTWPHSAKPTRTCSHHEQTRRHPGADLPPRDPDGPRDRCRGHHPRATDFPLMGQAALSRLPDGPHACGDRSVRSGVDRIRSRCRIWATHHTHRRAIREQRRTVPASPSGIEFRRRGVHLHAAARGRREVLPRGRADRLQPGGPVTTVLAALSHGPGVSGDRDLGVPRPRLRTPRTRSVFLLLRRRGGDGVLL